MVVEYVGQLVRRSVVGLREEREYNAACGAGTYVFGMGAGLCIDATQVPKAASSISLTSTLHSCAYCCEAFDMGPGLLMRKGKTMGNCEVNQLVQPRP